MRITRETLLKIANDVIVQRTAPGSGVLAVYLHGMLATDEDPMLAGTVDVDLVFIHEYKDGQEREIVKLTNEVHLDILHHPREMYRQARQLRSHPWLGQAIYGCKILYDPRHFLDFAQASVRSQFFRAANILGRSQPQIESARQIWLALQLMTAAPGINEVHQYLQAIGQAANAVANLKGAPLTERRFLMDFATRMDQLGEPGFFTSVVGLLGGAAVSVEQVRGWLPAWENAYRAVGETEKPPPQLHPHRFWYYKRAYDEMLDSSQPHTVLWSLMNTWTKAVLYLPPEHAAHQQWQNEFLRIGLLGESFEEKVAALDIFLDRIEDYLEVWGQAQGV